MAPSWLYNLVDGTSIAIDFLKLSSIVFVVLFDHEKIEDRDIDARCASPLEQALIIDDNRRSEVHF